MTRLESNTVSKKSFLIMIDKLLKGEDIYKTVNNERKKIGAKNKLYLGNFYLEFQPYKSKDNEDRVNCSVGYTTFNDRMAIHKYKAEFKSANELID